MKCYYKPILFFPLVMLFGCSPELHVASMLDKPLSKERLIQTPILKVVYTNMAADVRKPTIMTQIPWVVIFPVPGLVGFFGLRQLEKSEGKRIVKECILPDFCQLVMNNFTEQVVKEIPNWPKMEIQQAPMMDANDYKRLEGSTGLSFMLNQIIFSDYGENKGFSASMLVGIWAEDGTPIWRQSFGYRPSDYGRAKEWDILIAEDCKLLKEEIYFAAERTVAFSIASLKKEWK